MVKIALITNIPSPYRVLLFNELGRVYGNSFKVFYCSRSEPNRKWDLPDLQHNYSFLKEGLVSFFNKSFYLNWDIWKNLKSFNPSIIITGGFNPTMLFSIIFARMYKKRHLINTDAWEITEASLSKYHILLRKFIYQNVAAFLPVSLKGKNNFIKNYNIPEHKIFIGHYSIQNERFSHVQSAMKEFDLIFSGQFVSRKMPLFFCDVVIELAKQKPDLKVVLLGSGPLENEILEKLKSSRINFTYPGFIQQDEIPKFFGASRIFLFPTLLDAWGVVANESCAAGVPVISCENAGVSGELVINGYNGFVLPLSVKVWVDHILELLSKKELYYNFSANCLEKIDDFTVKKSAEGFINAFNFVSEKVN